VTVIDTSGAVDFLLDIGVGDNVASLIRDEGPLAAPDVLTFELLAVLRRDVIRGALETRLAAGAVEDYGDVAIDLFPSIRLRRRAFELRDRLTAADALFVALAERLDEPLATKDRGLLRTAKQLGLAAVELGAGAAPGHPPPPSR
jgi:predicted nucleic acid-binding protein